MKGFWEAKLLTMKRCWLGSGGWGIGPVGRKGRPPGVVPEKMEGRGGQGRYQMICHERSVLHWLLTMEPHHLWVGELDCCGLQGVV